MQLILIFYDRGTFQKLIDKLSQAESGTQGISRRYKAAK